MSHLIINKAQADAIRGNHGKYSAIEPVPTPDGKYIVPEACLSDKDLAEIKTTLESYVTPTNVQEITDLPDIGQQCLKDVIYKYSEGDIDTGYNGLVICMQPHNRTIYPPMDTPALFSFFRENTDDLEWIPNEMVEMGWKRWHEGKQYEVIQPHQTQSDYTPMATLGVLWKEVPQQADEYPVFVHPTGAHDVYMAGNIVWYPTLNSTLYRSKIDNNSWSPDEYANGWEIYVP